jgi:hypothetical protein
MRDSLTLYYQLIKKDSKGNIIKKYKKYKARSFVRQFIEFYLVQYGFIDATQMPYTIRDTSNTTQTISMAGNFWNFWTSNTGGLSAPVSNTNYGSVVGSADTAVTINDYALATKIAHGTSAGQLQYSVETFGAPTTDAAGSSWIAVRVFTNGSGNDVTIKEIGLILYNQYPATYYFLFARDVLASPVTLANGETVTLNYTFLTAI